MFGHLWSLSVTGPCVSAIGPEADATEGCLHLSEELRAVLAKRVLLPYLLCPLSQVA